MPERPRLTIGTHIIWKNWFVPCVQYVVKKLKQQGVGRGNLSATGDVKGAAREDTKPTTS